MAITGTGTQADPYLVHSYSELKTVTTDNSYCPQYSHRYIALDADINCNDYGVSFEWETIALGHDSRGFTLDLNGHTIKNIAVKLNNSVFDASYAGANVYGAWYAEFIGNGKLLNVFSAENSTGYLIKGRGISNTISNLSISCVLGNNSRGVFRDTLLNAIACYIESNTFAYTQDVNALILSFSQAGDTASTSDPRIQNSDFEIHVSNLKTPLYSAYNLRQQLAILGGRIRGKASTDNANIYFIACGYMQNCVVNLDTTEYVSSNSHISRYNSTGVINTDINSAGVAIDGMTSVTSAEIVNGDALRAKGFTVVNVSG